MSTKVKHLTPLPSEKGLADQLSDESRNYQDVERCIDWFQEAVAALSNPDTSSDAAAFYRKEAKLVAGEAKEELSALFASKLSSLNMAK